MQEDALLEGLQGQRETPNLFHIPLDTVKEVSSFLRKASGAFPMLESRASHGSSGPSQLLKQDPTTYPWAWNWWRGEEEARKGQGLGA